MKFRLLAGSHIQPLPEPDENGNTEKVYNVGDVFDAPLDKKGNPIDLAARYNRPGSIKFERINAPYANETKAQRIARLKAELEEAEGMPSQEEEVDPRVASLNGMTVMQLRGLAADEEVTIPPGAKREDIVGALRQHFANRALEV